MLVNALDSYTCCPSLCSYTCTHYIQSYTPLSPRFAYTLRSPLASLIHSTLPPLRSYAPLSPRFTHTLRSPLHPRASPVHTLARLITRALKVAAAQAALELALRAKEAQKRAGFHIFARRLANLGPE